VSLFPISISIDRPAWPYHNDPGLNRGILDEFEKLGYPLFSRNTLPLDEDLLERQAVASIKLRGRDSTEKNEQDVRNEAPQDAQSASATQSPTHASGADFQAALS